MNETQHKPKVLLNLRMAKLAGLENISIEGDQVFANKPKSEITSDNVININGPVDFLTDWNLLMPLFIKLGMFEGLTVDNQPQLILCNYILNMMESENE